MSIVTIINALAVAVQSNLDKGNAVPRSFLIVAYRYVRDNSSSCDTDELTDACHYYLHTDTSVDAGYVIVNALHAHANVTHLLSMS